MTSVNERLRTARCRLLRRMRVEVDAWEAVAEVTTHAATARRFRRQAVITVHEARHLSELSGPARTS